ncbi:unnamed protein product, partial [Amoebophrya sp. A25]
DKFWNNLVDRLFFSVNRRSFLLSAILARPCFLLILRPRPRFRFT